MLLATVEVLEDTSSTLRAISGSCSILLHHGGGDRHGDIVDLAHRAGDALDGRPGADRRALDRADLPTNLIGGVGALLRQTFNFGSDNRKPLARR